MSKNRQKYRSHNQTPTFQEECRRVFGDLYRKNNQPYILIAQNRLEVMVEQGMVTTHEALTTLHTPSIFAEYLLDAEKEYNDRESQRLHARMAGVEKNTHWKAAAGVSIGTGAVTGVLFTLAGPFVSSWLQPTADALFKRQASASTVAGPQPQTIQNITNNYTYNFPAPVTKPANEVQPVEPTAEPKTAPARLSCKNAAPGVYNATLAELLLRGNIVTLEMNGKKVSLCYRPDVEHAGQQRAFAR